MTKKSPTTKTPRPRNVAERARLLAEICADVSIGIIGQHDPTDVEIAGLAADFEREFARPPLGAYLAEPTETPDNCPPSAPRQRQPHIPSITKMIERAAKTGKPFSITLPNGAKLQVGEPEQQSADVEQWIARHEGKTQKR